MSRESVFVCPLVNRDVKETVEALGLDIGSRDISERECQSSVSHRK